MIPERQMPDPSITDPLFDRTAVPLVRILIAMACAVAVGAIIGLTATPPLPGF